MRDMSTLQPTFSKCDDIVPLPPSPDSMVDIDTSFGGNDELSRLISDLGVFDDSLIHHGEDHNVAARPSPEQQQPSDQLESNSKSISPSVAERRVERTRERNRKAQARYRQKLKVI